METKKLLVSFLAIASLLIVATAFVSANELASGVSTFIDNAGVDNTGIVAGDTMTIQVIFTSDVNASDVTVEVELEGDKADAQVETRYFDVESGHRYTKFLNLKVPYELKDQLSDDATLTVKISGDGFETEQVYDVRIQRQPYEASVMSVSADQTISAGATFPVDIVLKNTGYNNLDDVYVTVMVPELGLQKSAYFGDIVSVECDDQFSSVENYNVDVDRKCNEDDDDSVAGRIFLNMPYDAKAGAYTLQVKVKNDDTTTSASTQFNVQNNVANEVAVDSSQKSVAEDENAEFNLLLVNPTNQVKVYRIVTESTSGLSTSTDTSVVAVPAGSSKNVRIIASAQDSGEYQFTTSVFSGEQLVESVPMTVKVSGSSATSNPLVILTVILAIIFVVLLIVLIVLMSRKPERSEEFGESYY
ncbi:MAG: hypothetical protein Q7S56_03385 [Nanoarchaeota archaeon]|nr:hypothetical protein [Nanoarchaeota archaeon]